MAQSMTGFGRGEALIGEMTVRVEIKSVNNKQMKSTLRMPSWLNYLETAFESELKKSFKRGSFFASVSAERNEEAQVAVNHEKLEALMRAFSARGLNQQPLCLVPGVIEENQRPTLTEGEEVDVLKVFRAALTDLEASRRKEGEALTLVLVNTLESLDQERQCIYDSYTEHKENMETKLKVRLAELSERDGALQQSLDPLLISRELALHVDRVDIREELDRLSMHIREATSILEEAQGPCGRKLEFMAQEMGREVNTTGSKSQSYQISKAVVEMKTYLEQFREQIANIE